jgi:hypothetical protein
MYKTLTIGLFILIFISCQSDKKKEESRQINYFDLQTYFKEKATEFTKVNSTINKQITVNNLTERQKLKIANWEEEFSMFIKSDINKIAWKNSYTKDSTAQKVVYTAKDEQLKTQKITILFSQQQLIKQILINNVVDNLLYHGTEDLTYTPNQGYEIKKHQKVFLLGEKNYLIKGGF